MHSIFSFLFLSLIFSSCSILQKREKTFEVTFHATIFKPHCGGAKPTAATENGFYEALTDERYAIIRGNVYAPGAKIEAEITLDTIGSATLKLPKGEYMLLKTDKLLPIEEFMRQNKPFEKEVFKLKSLECFEQWKNSPDFSISIEKDTSIALQKNAKCWVGTNPCLEYIGPPAP
jgi:hypothetical protein